MERQRKQPVYDSGWLWVCVCVWGRLYADRQFNMPDCQSLPLCSFDAREGARAHNGAGNAASTSCYVGHYTSIAPCLHPSLHHLLSLHPCPDFAAVFFSLVAIGRVIDAAFTAERAESMRVWSKLYES